MPGAALQRCVRLLAIQCVECGLDGLALSLEWSGERCLAVLQRRYLALEGGLRRPARIAVGGDLLEIDDSNDSARNSLGMSCRRHHGRGGK